MHRTTIHNKQASRRRGWNLIELLVVVAIIVILLGIIVNTAAEGVGPKEQTEIIVKGAAAIATEYEVQTKTIIDHKVDPPGYTGASEPIGRFVWHVKQYSVTRKMLMGLGKDAVGTTDDPTVITDAWGEKLYYAAKVEPDEFADDDFLPRYHTAFFASAGPDGKWGKHDPATGKRDEDAQDNIYSHHLK